MSSNTELTGDGAKTISYKQNHFQKRKGDELQFEDCLISPSDNANEIAELWNKLRMT